MIKIDECKYGWKGCVYFKVNWMLGVNKGILKRIDLF